VQRAPRLSRRVSVEQYPFKVLLLKKSEVRPPGRTSLCRLLCWQIKEGAVVWAGESLVHPATKLRFTKAPLLDASEQGRADQIFSPRVLFAMASRFNRFLSCCAALLSGFELLQPLLKCCNAFVSA
jgi:hypothetical protein